MKKFARIALCVLLCTTTACGVGEIEFPTVQETDAPVDPSRAVADRIGMTDAEFDEYQADVDFVLSDLESYWAKELPELFGVEAVPPSAFIEYRSIEDAPTCGGEKMEPGNAFYCAPENYIAWDEANLLMPFFHEVGDFAVAYVLAHEWGHAVQKQVGARARAGIFFELQADCYAGAWGADADERGILEPGDLEEGVRAIETVGDEAGVPWFDPQAHGSASERRATFELGFEEGAKACKNIKA